MLQEIVRLSTQSEPTRVLKHGIKTTQLIACVHMQTATCTVNAAMGVAHVQSLTSRALGMSTLQSIQSRTPSTYSEWRACTAFTMRPCPGCK